MLDRDTTLFSSLFHIPCEVQSIIHGSWCLGLNLSSDIERSRMSKLLGHIARSLQLHGGGQKLGVRDIELEVLGLILPFDMKLAWVAACSSVSYIIIVMGYERGYYMYSLIVVPALPCHNN